MVRSTSQPKTHQQSVRSRRLQAFIGSLHSTADLLQRDYVNMNPEAAQVSTIVVDTFSSGDDYEFTFNGVLYDMTEDGTGANVNDVASQLEAFINAQGSIYGFLTAEANADTVTLTGRLPGYSWDISDADAKLTTTGSVTAAADADKITFGSAIAKGGYGDVDELTLDDNIQEAALCVASYFTAQVDTWSIGAGLGAGDALDVTVRIAGVDETIHVSAVFNTDTDTTLDDAATLLNAALTDIGANAYVTVAGPSGSPCAGELEFTAAIAGVEFTSMISTTEAASYPAITVNSNKQLSHGSGRTSIAASFAGVAVRVADQEADLDYDSSSTAQVDINETFVCVERGELWVANSQSVDCGEQVYIDTAASQGLFYNSAAAGRVPLPRSRAEWVKSGRSIDGEALSLLRLL